MVSEGPVGLVGLEAGEKGCGQMLCDCRHLDI